MDNVCKEIPNIYRLDNYIESILSYKQIAEILEIKYCTGNSKIKQMKIIEQFYELEKVKSKYKILYKHEIPYIIDDNRKSVYYDSLETILLYALNNSDRYTTWSVSRSLFIATLTNNNYNIGKKDLKLTAEALEVDENYLYDFYNVSYSRLRRIFESALNRMQSKRLIQYNTCVMICRKTPKIELNKVGDPVINEKGELQYRIYETFTEATTTERELILQAENRVLEELNYGSVQQLILSKQYELFKRKVNSILRKEANIIFYYGAYSIVKYNKKIASEIHSLNNTLSMKNLNDLKVSSFTVSQSEKLNKNLEDKEILIDWLLDNKSNLDLYKLLSTHKEDIEPVESDDMHIDKVPF